MPKPLLCVTVTAPNMAELCHRRDAVTDADLVELRLDTVSDPDAAGALAGRRRPVIVTCRPEWEGGHFKGSEEERKRILAKRADAWRGIRRHRITGGLRRSRIPCGRPASGAFAPRLHGHAVGSPGPRSGDAINRCRGRQDRGQDRAAQRLRIAAQSPRPGRWRARRRPGGDGALRPCDACARRAIRIDVDVCGLGPRGGPGVGSGAAAGLPVPRPDRCDRDIRPGRVAGRSLRVARDAQRSVRGNRARCDLPPVSSRQRRRFHDLRPRARSQRCQRHHPAQGVAVRTGRRGGRSPRAASGPSTAFA